MNADETLTPGKDETEDDDSDGGLGDAADEDQMDEDEVAEQILDDDGVLTTPPRQNNKVKSTKANVTKTPRAKGTAKAAITPGTVKKKKPRKSEQLNLNALSQEQLMVAEMEGSKIQQLKLKRKYYCDALELIRWLDGAAPDLCNLLGSTSKAEVLEAMEYFRIALEYRLDTAPVRHSPFLTIRLTLFSQTGIKKMIHLIWTKDNTSSGEDGKELKGIRAKLLECYRSLYFEPVPDIEPKQQVNRITKNMIE